MTEFGSVAIVGLGLIGGSIAAGLKQRGLARVSAWDADAASLETGLQQGVIDAVLPSAAAAAEADILILCVPVQSVAEVLTEIPATDQIITDVGSVKAALIGAVRPPAAPFWSTLQRGSTACCTRPSRPAIT